MTAMQNFDEYLTLFRERLPLLEDKPEETPENTLKALWLSAAGQAVSAVSAEQMPLPELSAAQQEQLERAVQRRLAGEPLAHITGRQTFCGIDFMVDGKALIPRKETELLAHQAIGILQRNALSGPVLDLCTGVANLAITMALRHPDIRIHASDLSADALELAAENTRLHGVGDRIQLHQGDLFEPFDNERFRESCELIVCNPPYISSAKVEDMPSEISAYEPAMAFDGGPFGVNFLRKLIASAPDYLDAGGWLAFEVGRGQGDAVIKMMQRQRRYRSIEDVRDEQGDIRVIVAQK